MTSSIPADTPEQQARIAKLQQMTPNKNAPMAVFLASDAAKRDHRPGVRDPHNEIFLMSQTGHCGACSAARAGPRGYRRARRPALHASLVRSTAAPMCSTGIRRRAGFRPTRRRAGAREASPAHCRSASALSTRAGRAGQEDIPVERQRVWTADQRRRDLDPRAPERLGGEKFIPSVHDQVDAVDAGVAQQRALNAAPCQTPRDRVSSQRTGTRKSSRRLCAIPAACGVRRSASRPPLTRMGSAVRRCRAAPVRSRSERVEPGFGPGRVHQVRQVAG